ncbi:MAG: GntR family transcriptional regulator [Planctomycetales bacterium]|nr:GntR family transcriptional regulator [Planctomycetales bacterium]
MLTPNSASASSTPDDVSVGATGKRRQIVEAVRDRIRTGAFQPGDRIPSDAELVREFGVSRPTVAKALQELQDCGLVKRKVGSGTYVLRSQTVSAQQFGLLIPGLGQTEIFEPICAQMACAARTNNHSLLWGAHGGSAAPGNEGDWAIELCRHYIDSKVSGVFFAPLEYLPNRLQVNEQIVGAFQDANISVVLLDRDYLPYPMRSSLDLVGVDNRRVGYIVTHHLFQRGCKRVVFFSRPRSASTIDARVAGFIEAVIKDSGGFSNELVVRCEPDDTDAIRHMLSDVKPDGIVCGNDVTAGQLLRSLGELRVRVPDKIRVTGVDDVRYAGLLSVPLTTVRQPCAALGDSAFKAMLDRVAKPDAPAKSILLDAELVIRASTGDNH